METRSLILTTAVELLAQSPTGDVSTRAICEAAGVTQPVLYRHFGDKDGLLAAVVDVVWEEYLATKRAAVATSDPLEELRAGWDSHIAFATEHPHAYRLVFGSTLSTRPAALDEAMRLLTAILERLAAQGRLRLAPAEAARIVMAANSGLALGLILRPEAYPDRALSSAMREATLRSLLPESSTAGESGTAARDAVEAARTAATTLLSHLTGSDRFTDGELGLLQEWLRRIQRTPAP